MSRLVAIAAALIVAVATPTASVLASEDGPEPGSDGATRKSCAAVLDAAPRQASVIEIVQQAYHVAVSSDARTGQGSDAEEHEVRCTSFDGDPSRQSTRTVDGGEPESIGPLGLEGVGLVLTSSATAPAASASADALLDIQMNEDAEVGVFWIAGDYATTLVGDAVECDAEPAAGSGSECVSASARTTARASSGIVFSIPTDMDVTVSWRCELSLELMEVVGAERGDVIIDGSAPCSGEHEGRLEGGRSYQLLVSLGLFDALGAMVQPGQPPMVVDAVGIVDPGVASYRLEQSGAFVMELTTPG